MKILLIVPPSNICIKLSNKILNDDTFDQYNYNDVR